MDLTLIEQLNKYRVDGNGFKSMSRRIRVNAVTAEYYQRLGEEFIDLEKTRNGKTYDFEYLTSRRSNRVLRCGRYIQTTRYGSYEVRADGDEKDFISAGFHNVKQIKLCGDKFCGNCQKRLANARERRYTPLLNELSAAFDIYHVTLTVPNVPALFLPKSVEDIVKAFQKLIKFMSGRKRIRDQPFGGLGFVGAIRSLEITHNVKADTYHPHLHCLFVMKKGLNLDKPKVFTNTFSFSNGRKDSKFSAFEVLIQKLWKLCYDGDKVTKSAIEHSGGYSCKVNMADGNYHQIFKYVVKGLLDDKHAQQRRDKTCRIDNGLTYEEFKALFFALEGRRAIQGYGCFYKLKLDGELEDGSDSSEVEIRHITHELRKLYDDESVSEKLSAVIENINKNEIYFSKNVMREKIEDFKGED